MAKRKKRGDKGKDVVSYVLLLYSGDVFLVIFWQCLNKRVQRGEKKGG